MKDFKDRLQNILETNFGTKDNAFALLKNNPPSGFDQLKKKKNEYKNEINFNALNSYSSKSKTLTQNNNMDKSSSLNKLSNIRSMILNENKDIFKGISSTLKTPTENKFQAYETLNTNTCSPKNSFYLNSLNSTSLPLNKNDFRNSVLSTDANYNSQNASKLRNSFEKFTNDLLKGTKKNTNSNSKSKYNRGQNPYLDYNNTYNNQNTNPNINKYSTGNPQTAYKDMLIAQQENRFAKMKKEKILSLLDDKPSAFENHFNKELSNRNNTDRTLGKNYFSASVYPSQNKTPKNNLENSHYYNSILHQNPDVRIELVNGNSNKNGISNNTSTYNIENFGLLPTSSNSSFNGLNSNNNSSHKYNKTNAGKEFTQFLHASKNKHNKDFHHNFINSPLKSNLSNGNSAASRNSLKNLKAVKSQLENLFEKNDSKDKGYNNAMDNLCAFLNQKNKKPNGAHVQHTDKSVKLMEEIKDMRKSISNNRAKSANRPAINPTSPSNSKNNYHNTSGYLNTVFAFSPTSNKSIIKANTSNFIVSNNPHKSIFSANINVSKSQNLQSGGNTLNTSLNTTNYFSNKNNNVNNSNYFREMDNLNKSSSFNFFSNNNNNNTNLSGNYGRLMVPTNENLYSNNYNLHTFSDVNSNYNTINNSANRFNFSKKNGVGSRLNTVVNDESVEEFTRDLENPNRKDSLIMKYLKKKKLTL